MVLPEQNIRKYSETLASASPAPGGGAATALTASQGAGLVAMVCQLTLGKEAYQEQQGLAEELLEKALSLQEKALLLMDEDAESFGEVGKVYQMPKETPEEKQLRGQAMEKALKGCTLPPLALMDLCVRGLELTERALGKTTAHAVSDLGVAALFFKSALEGAWLNVKINVAYIKDEEFAKKHEKQGQALRNTGIALGDTLYKSVLETL